MIVKRRIKMQKDTSAWIMQVWISFAIAFTTALYGIYSIQLDNWPKAFMLMGVLTSILSAFTLAKMMRDNKEKQQDTNAWIMQVWLGFGITTVMTIIGLWNMPDGNSRLVLGISFLFVLSQTFTLAKTIRDNHEVQVKPLSKVEAL